MEIIDLIQNADSIPEILSALSLYVESLRHIPSIPDWCVGPLQEEGDIRERIAVLFTVVNLTSQHLQGRECNAAKRALRAFAVALRRIQAITTSRDASATGLPKR